VLIVSDKAANVERIANIIRRVDLASNEQVEIVPLRHATASEVVRTLTALEQNRSAGDPAAAAISGSQLVPDERTNSVLMSGDTLSRLRLRTLIAHLDTPLQGGGNTQVFYLRYAKAPDLVPVLQGVSQQITEEASGAAQVVTARSRELVDIQADEATNALVVTAPPDILQSLRRVISQLDVRRAQVLVEAAIAEISKEKTAELGVQWVVDGTQNGNAVGFTNFNIGTSLGQVLRSIIEVEQGNASNIAIPQGLNLGLGSFDGSFRFAAIISALAADTDTNILSTPTLVTLDNEEAEIVVGQNRAFLTGSFTTSADGASNPFQTIERRDVGLTLKIRPQINEGNAVQLEISQEVETVIAITSTGPETNKRSIKTNVLVEDGQILVLGGLIDDALAESVQKVPGLGDIPILGNLFRYRKTQKEKRNLMIFLHPVILRDSVTGTIATNNKYSFIREQQIAARQRGVALLPDESTPLLTPQYEVKRQRSMIDRRAYSPEDPAQVSQYPQSMPAPPTTYPGSGYAPQATPQPQDTTPALPAQTPADSSSATTLKRGFGNK
jgi:general secretion pathway protein D